jgi:hypothetical protein
VKRYNYKRFKEEDSLDNKTPASIRKYFNSAERQYAKREIRKAQEVLIEDKEIKIVERFDLERALDRKYENIRFNFAVTLHNLGIPLWPGGDKTNFDYYWKYCDFQCNYDYCGLTDAELLERLALQLISNNVIDLNLAIKNARYPWWF